MTNTSAYYSMYTLPPQVEPILQPKTSLQWKKCADIPVGMYSAQAVVLKDKVYVGGGFTESGATVATLCIYTASADTWDTLPSPTRVSALTTYHSQLVLVGGWIACTYEATNQLWVLQEDERTWRQTLPAMSTGRRGASAISHHNHLIVAGGQDSNFRDTSAVEVYDSHQWMTTDPLPKCCSFMKTTIHDGTYYLVGGYSQGQSMFCASVQSIIAKTTLQSPTSPSNGEQKSVWETLPDVPYRCSATTILGAALVTVGGYDRSGTPSSSLHMFSPLTHSWLHVGEMPVAVSHTCTITLPTGDMMMIGRETEDIPYYTVYKGSLHI